MAKKQSLERIQTNAKWASDPGPLKGKGSFKEQKQVKIIGDEDVIEVMKRELPRAKPEPYLNGSPPKQELEEEFKRQRLR